MPQDKIYASLGIKHVYFSNVDMEYEADGKFLSCSNTATFWASGERFRDVAACVLVTFWRMCCGMVVCFESAA